MAALSGVSLRHLERFFAATFRKTPRLWVQELRAQLACDLLRQGWKAGAVAAELHYASASHLNWNLKRFHGATSGAFTPHYGDGGPRPAWALPRASSSFTLWPLPSPSPIPSPAPRARAQ